MDPGSLLIENDAPRFLWRDEARFKHLAARDENQQAGIASFGRAVAGALASAATDLPSRDLSGVPAGQVRETLTRGGVPVDLRALLAIAWSYGIPVVHLRVFPWPQKRMAAMTTRVSGRAAILLAKDASYPPWLAFYLAHELGHLACGHVGDGEAVVDLDQGDVWTPGDDDEEDTADRWALELLTGRERPEVTADFENRSAAALAHSALSAGADLVIEPGTLALAFGYTTGDWQTANGALKILYPRAINLPAFVNSIAVREVDLADAGEEASDFLYDVLNLNEHRP